MVLDRAVMRPRVINPLLLKLCGNPFIFSGASQDFLPGFSGHRGMDE
jgi:hypothetical protein